MIFIYLEWLGKWLIDPSCHNELQSLKSSSYSMWLHKLEIQPLKESVRTPVTYLGIKVVEQFCLPPSPYVARFPKGKALTISQGECSRHFCLVYCSFVFHEGLVIFPFSLGGKCSEIQVNIRNKLKPGLSILLSHPSNPAFLVKHH